MEDPRYPIGKYIAQPLSEKQLEEWLQDIDSLPLQLENAILNLDEAGETGAAAACAVMIAAASTVVTLLFMALGAWVDRRTQAWRQPAR